LKKRLWVLIVLMILALACGGCSSQPASAPAPTPQAQPVTLTVAAAASLTDAAKEIQTVYSTKHPNVTITYNLAASGTLQQQIEQGAPVDLFISAGKSQMDALEQKGLIVASTRKNVVGNELVLVAGKDSKLAAFDGLKDAAVKKIAIGTPESVPAGQYAKDTLTTLGMWGQLQAKFIQAKDVRSVLNYVEKGEVDAGLVYRTDAAASTAVKIVAAAPAGSSKPIVYPMAIIASSKHQQEAQQFEDFLASDEAARLFAQYGFTKPAQ